MNVPGELETRTKLFDPVPISNTRERERENKEMTTYYLSDKLLFIASYFRHLGQHDLAVHISKDAPKGL